MTDTWYKSVEVNDRLTQGDLIFNCPILTWKSEISQLQTIEGETLKREIEAIQADVIVITQACDLENEKVSNVILCPHFSISEYRKNWEKSMRAIDQNPTEKAWRRLCDDIKDGYCWNLSMLNNGVVGELIIEHRIVDFHDVYTIPRDFLESLLRQRQLSRVRLLPPYREHLSQAFARFFMRVGLPVGVSKIW